MFDVVNFKIFKSLRKNNHAKRIYDLKQYENDFNFKNISFPIKLTDISKFEKQNSNIPPINVFSINNKNEVYPLRLNDQSSEKTIDLFLHQKDDNSHCFLIKNFNRLIDLQVSKNTDIKKNTFIKDVYNIVQNQN